MKTEMEFNIPKELFSSPKELDDYINDCIDKVIGSLGIEAVITEDKRLVIKYGENEDVA